MGLRDDAPLVAEDERRMPLAGQELQAKLPAERPANLADAKGHLAAGEERLEDGELAPQPIVQRVDVLAEEKKVIVKRRLIVGAGLGDAWAGAVDGIGDVAHNHCSVGVEFEDKRPAALPLLAD